MVEQDFVCFLSPGTFMSESSEKPIVGWDVHEACKMARAIKERHGATPYGFYFYTKRREDHELDSKTVATSPMYYLGGQVYTYNEIALRDDPSEQILRENMRCNEIERVIVNTNSYKVTMPLKPMDIVLDWKK